MRALVIGGTRFIGAHVVRQLHDRGVKVTVFHRGQSRNAALPDIEHVCDPRRCLHSEATFECRDEIEEASIVSGEFVVARCDASEVFDLAEEAFDQVSVFVDRGIEAAPFGGDGPAWDDGLCTAGCDSVHGPLPIVTLVRQNVPCLQPLEKRLDLGDIVALATGQDEANGIAQRIGRGMNLGTQTAF